MGMTKEQLKELAQISIDGELNCKSIDQFCLRYSDITEEEGYEGQEIRLALMEEKGFHTVGWKLGGTSAAKLKQLHSDIYSSAAAVTKPQQITYGRLFDYMQLKCSEELLMSKHLHPKVEPEIAFIMKNDLCGRNVTAVDVMANTLEIRAAFEIIDSRFHDFKIGRRYDALIDNTSSSAFMLGEQGIDPNSVDLKAIGMKVLYNGDDVGFGCGESIMGHPARAVAELVGMLAQRGLGLKAGDIVLSGAIVASRPVHSGDFIRADFSDGLGFVETQVK